MNEPQNVASFGVWQSEFVKRRFDVPDHWRGRVVMQYGTKTTAEAEREEDEEAGIPVGDMPEATEEEEKPPPLCLSGTRSLRVPPRGT